MDIQAYISELNELDKQIQKLKQKKRMLVNQFISENKNRQSTNEEVLSHP